MTRQSWLDDKTNEPLIDDYARQLTTFVEALADDKVDAGELESQEARLVELMKEVEPQLDDELHGKVTRLLCELTAYNVMQLLHTMQEARPKVQFRG